MSRRLSMLLLGILSCLCVAFGPPMLTDSDLPRCQLAPHQVRAMRQVAVPKVSAAAVILVDSATGQVLYAHNEHERRAPASFTKIATAIVALQRARQDKEIRVKSEDLVVYSVTNLQNGEQLSLRQLLFMLLLPSDNAAAMTIARGVAGDVRTFVGWMNELAAALGAQNTHFTNPHGLDSKGNYTTAYDMAIIARYAMTNSTFAEIVRRADGIAAARNLENTNTLLRTYSGAIGIKTGTTDNAGDCLVSMADRPSGRPLLVVMGAQDRFLDSTLLLDYYYANFAELYIDLPETDQNRYLDPNNTWHSIRIREPLVMLIKPWQRDAVQIYRRIDNPSAAPGPDEAVGVLQVMAGCKLLAEVPIYAR